MSDLNEVGGDLPAVLEEALLEDEPVITGGGGNLLH